MDNKTNAEPFAYAWEHLNDWHFSKEQVVFSAMVGSPVPIPLYTTPQTKPLSDEEIKQFAKKWWELPEHWWDRKEGDIWLAVSGFARAIEAKVRGGK